MKIGLVIKGDPFSTAYRSGVPYFIRKALIHNGHEVVLISLKDNRSIFEKMVSRLLHIWYNKLLGGRQGYFDAVYTPAMVRGYWQNKHTEQAELNMLLAIDMIHVGKLKPRVPLAIWTDNLVETYAKNPAVGSPCALNLRSAAQFEKKVMENATQIFVASHWLAEHIEDRYKQEFSDKVQVLPRGASLLQRPDADRILAGLAAKMAETVPTVLFVCSNWKLKGGDFFVEVITALRTLMPVRPMVCGRVTTAAHAKLTAAQIPYSGPVDKQDAESYNSYCRLLAKAHFMTIFSMAEGFGITYAEAASFGVPSVGFAVSGVTEAVQQGVTGLLFQAGASPKIIAGEMVNLWADKQRYAALCRSAKKYSDTFFDWNKNTQILMDKTLPNK